MDVLNVQEVNIVGVRSGWLNWVVTPPGVTIWCDMCLPWDVDWGEPIRQELLLLIIQSWVWNVTKFRGGGEYLDQWGVIKAEG